MWEGKKQSLNGCLKWTIWMITLPGFGLSGRGTVGAWEATTGSKQKEDPSDWTGALEGESSKTSGCDEAGLSINKLEDSEARTVGEARGAEGSVGDLVSQTVWVWSFLWGTSGRASAGGLGREGDVGGETGALGLCGEVTGRKSGLAGGEVARKMGEGGIREKGETRGELRGEDGLASSALVKMKAVSVRLRW